MTKMDLRRDGKFAETKCHKRGWKGYQATVPEIKAESERLRAEIYVI